MNSWKSILADNHAKTITILAAVLVAGIIGAVVLASSQRQFLAKTPEPATSSPVTTAKTTNTPLDEAPVADTPANTSATPAARPNTSTTVSRSPVPNPQPFSIAHASLGGASWSCGVGGVVTVQILYAVIGANNLAGGPFTWQVEVNGAPTPYAPSPATASVPANQTAQFVKSATDPSGLLYSSSYARDGQSIRVHVTSPNDVVSPWFTIPAGSESKCANP